MHFKLGSPVSNEAFIRISSSGDTPSPPTRTYYDLKPSDLWDNTPGLPSGRDLPFSRFLFRTEATILDVQVNSTLRASFPDLAHVVLRVDGEDYAVLPVMQDGVSNIRAYLPPARSW